MSALAIASSLTSHAEPGDFAAELAGGKLFLPEDVATSLAPLSIRTAADFISFLATFPTAVARALGWRVEEVETARGKLIRDLKGSLPEELLELDSRFERPLGAFDPSSLS